MERIDLNNRRNSTYIVLAVGAVFIAILLFTQLSQSPSNYVAQTEKLRQQKDLQFKNDPNSPIPKPERGAFEGLTYFPVQEFYRAEGVLVRNPSPDTLQLMGSKGGDTPDRLVKIGQVRFRLLDRTYMLSVFDYLDKTVDTYFIPFSDLTTGLSTYGGGRYLDIPKAEPLVIDFNHAYHPYCVYNENFLCPLPPAENRLNLEVMAGEKMR